MNIQIKPKHFSPDEGPSIRPEACVKQGLQKGRASALDVIDASIQRPKKPDPEFQRFIERMAAESDVQGLIALYDAFVAADAAYTAVYNMPRSQGRVLDYLEDVLMVDAWARAYAIAGQLKKLTPTPYERERYCKTLFSCALAMGNSLEAAAAIVSEISKGAR